MREIIEDTSSPRYNLAKWFSLVAKMLEERNDSAIYLKIFDEFKESKIENFLISFV